jgi:hypothetical protein
LLEETAFSAELAWTKVPVYVGRQIARETIVVPVRGGTVDLEAVFTMNEVLLVAVSFHRRLDRPGAESSFQVFQRKS